MIEIEDWFISDLFPGLSVDYFSGTKEVMQEIHHNIIFYSKNEHHYRYITSSAVINWLMMHRNLIESERSEMMRRMIFLEQEIHELKQNTIVIETEDHAYLLLKYK